jgi:myo-inositol-1(or 4)-monophosphatase
MAELAAEKGIDGFRNRLLRAQDLARSVGRAALEFRRSASLEALKVTTKGLQDFVTIADKRAEETIRIELADAFPEDGFLGEETGGTVSMDRYWVVDPIDGTSNYIRGLRHWGVSIAFVAEGEVQVGAIFDAAFDQVYSAVRGCGAFREGVPIRASRVSNPSEAFSIVGYSRRTSFEDYQAMTRRLHDMGMDYRRIGSAALGLARVAAGVADLYYERHLNVWDILAGALIAREAGAAVHMPPLNELLAKGGPVMACAPGLDEKIAFLREADPPRDDDRGDASATRAP